MSERFYSVLIETTKGRIGLELASYRFTDDVLNALKIFAKSKRVPSGIAPGFVQLQLGTWHIELDSAKVSRAHIIRGNVAVSIPAAGQACNLLLARVPARRLNSMYVHLGVVSTGMDTVDRMTVDDLIADVYWAEHERRSEVTGGPVALAGRTLM
jgi:hypothetical protein